MISLDVSGGGGGAPLTTVVATAFAGAGAAPIFVHPVLPDAWDIPTITVLQYDGPPCEATFEKLARSRVDALLDWITSGTLDPADLTFAAEAAGQHGRGERLIQVLISLLEHPRAYVREGAVYGISYHLDDQRVRAALTTLRDRETVRPLAELAAELLAM